MLYYGNAQNIQDQCVVFNFTSYIEGYRRLNLVPPNSLGASNEYQFDQLYMDYIFSNDSLFAELFTIINCLYIGASVYIIISEDPWSETLIESILKMIQQRYGYGSTKVNCFEDVIFSEPGSFNTEYGLLNLDADMERYVYILESIRLANGGVIYGN